MVITFQAIQGCGVDAADGDLGSLNDVLFDGSSWVIRYLVISVGGWKTRHCVLSPAAVERVDWPNERIRVRPSRKLINEAPSVDDVRPLPREKEFELAKHFGWKPYWMPGAAGALDGLGVPTPTVPDRIEAESSNLWNADKLIDFSVRATDGEIGYVEDFILDDNLWVIRYLVIDIGNVITGRRVLQAVEWIDALDLDQRAITFALPTRTIWESPEFDPRSSVNCDYESRLYDYYGRSAPWEASR